MFRNGVLGYDRGWGAGGSKFSVQAAGALVENCWFHDNYRPGIWFDIQNRDTKIRSNLVENNGITLHDKIGGLGRGIFCEISYGPAKIYWNISRNNQETAILNSNSEGVEIYENAVYPNGIVVSHDNRGHQTSSKVHHNDIGRGDLPKGNGLAIGVGSVNGLDDALPRVAIDSTPTADLTPELNTGGQEDSGRVPQEPSANGKALDSTKTAGFYLRAPRFSLPRRFPLHSRHTVS